MSKFLNLLFLQFLRMKIINLFFFFLGIIFAQEYDFELKIFSDYNRGNNVEFYISSLKEQDNPIQLTVIDIDGIYSFSSANKKDSLYVFESNDEINKKIKDSFRNKKDSIHYFEKMEGIFKRIEKHIYTFNSKEDFLKLFRRHYKDIKREIRILYRRIYRLSRSVIYSI